MHACEILRRRDARGMPRALMFSAPPCDVSACRRRFLHAHMYFARIAKFGDYSQSSLLWLFSQCNGRKMDN